ncbi:ABC transporter substrate-binding protein, partial [Streptomyces sp. 12297]
MTTHRMSKRRLAAGTAVVLAAMLTATACGGGKDDEKDPAKNGAAGFNAGINQVANPSDKKGGELKFVGTQDADSWDPQRGYYGFMWDFSRYYSRQLVSFKPAPGTGSTELVPDLAAAQPEIAPDGKTYKFTLKDNVTWEDGTPVTS